MALEDRKLDRPTDPAVLAYDKLQREAFIPVVKERIGFRDEYTNALHLGNVEDEDMTGDAEANGAITGLDHYCMRLAVALSKDDRGEDILLVPDHLYAQAIQLVHYQMSIGVGKLPLENVIPVTCEHGERLSVAASRQASMLKELIKERLGIDNDKDISFVPFISSKDADAFADATGFSYDRRNEASEKGNHKGYSLAELRKLGVDIPEDILCRSKDEVRIAYKRLFDMGIVPMTKAARSASGQGKFMKLDSEEKLEAFLEDEGAQRILKAEGISLQEFVSNQLACLGVVFYVGKNKSEDRIVGFSDQLLAEDDEGIKSVHLGNVGKAKRKFWDKNPKLRADIGKTMDWLRSQGAYGYSGVDVIITGRPSNPEKGTKQKVTGHKLIEINCRSTGQLHAAMLADRMGAKYWKSDNNVHVPHGITLDAYLAFLHKKGINFDQNKGSGVVVINQTVTHKEKMQIVALGKTRKEVDALHAAATMTQVDLDGLDDTDFAAIHSLLPETMFVAGLHHAHQTIQSEWATGIKDDGDEVNVLDIPIKLVEIPGFE